MTTAPRRLALLAAAAALAGALPAPLSAQPAPPPQGLFGESLDVELVNVEVLVTDRQGRPVLDLGADDFRVFEDEQPVELTHFALVHDPAPAEGTDPGAGAAGEPAALPAASPPDAARIVIFIDNLHVGPASRFRVFQQLLDTLDRTLRPEDEVMVATYGGSIDVVLPFTRSRKRLREALERESLQGLSASQLQAGLEGERALQLVRNAQRNQAGEDLRPQGTCIELGSLAQNHAEEVYHRVQQSIGALTGFVNSLAGFPGRKTLLHVSDGIPLVAGAEVYSYAISLCDGTGAAQGIDYAEDTNLLGAGRFQRWDPMSAKTQMLSYDTTPDWQRLAAHANAHQVSVYTLQASGLENTFATDIGTGVETTAETARMGVRNRQDSLALIARETGGRALFNTNDFSTGIEAMAADTRAYYLLSFEPSNPGSGRIHRLRVEVDRPGARVRHRLSYRAKGTHERTADGVLTALLYERTENPLGVRIGVGDRQPAKNGISRVRLQVRLPLESLTLLPEEEDHRGLFTVFLAARDEDGRTTPVREAPVPVRVPEEGLGREFVYEVEMALRDGDHQVAVAVRDELAGTTSYLRGEVRAGRR